MEISLVSNLDGNIEKEKLWTAILEETLFLVSNSYFWELRSEHVGNYIYKDFCNFSILPHNRLLQRMNSLVSNVRR